MLFILSPIDYIKSQLDLAWPADAKLASFDDQKIFSGLTRILKKGASAELHQDIFYAVLLISVINLK